MNKEQILDTIMELAQSQGFYGRLYRNLMAHPQKDEILAEWESMNFRDSLDFILFIEA